MRPTCVLTEPAFDPLRVHFTRLGCHPLPARAIHSHYLTSRAASSAGCDTRFKRPYRIFLSRSISHTCASYRSQKEKRKKNGTSSPNSSKSLAIMSAVSSLLIAPQSAENAALLRETPEQVITFSPFLTHKTFTILPIIRTPLSATIHPPGRIANVVFSRLKKHYSISY